MHTLLLRLATLTLISVGGIVPGLAIALDHGSFSEVAHRGSGRREAPQNQNANELADTSAAIAYRGSGRRDAGTNT